MRSAPAMGSVCVEKGGGLLVFVVVWTFPVFDFFFQICGERRGVGGLDDIVCIEW